MDSLTKKVSSVIEEIFFGLIIKHPVSLSFKTSVIYLLNFFDVISSNAFAIVNLEKGLYSKFKISNFLKLNASY